MSLIFDGKDDFIETEDGEIFCDNAWYLVCIVQNGRKECTVYYEGGKVEEEEE